MPHTPRVGVVIANYNGFPFIKECLDSLAAIDYSGVKIVVVDNASTDGSREWASAWQKLPRHLIALSENKGFSGANNEGIRWCAADKCDYVLLLNNDTVVQPDFLSRLMDSAAAGSILVPKILAYHNRKLISSNAGHFDFRRGITVPWFYGKDDSERIRDAQTVPMAGACAILIPVGAFARVGLLDEKFFLYWEDTDFIVRAVREGFVVKFIPRAVIYHKESSSSGGRASRLATYYNNRNRLYFMYKHQKNIAILIFFLAYFFSGRCAYIIVGACRGEFRKIKALIFGIFDFYKGKMGRAPAQRYK